MTLDIMETTPSNSTSTLAHLSSCDCSYCLNQQSAKQLDVQNENWYAQVAEPNNTDTTADMARNDYFDNRAHDREGHDTSDSENSHTRDQDAIRDAPYLPRIQVWARPEGPYTLKIGHQWFHCDDLIVNGIEYRRQQPKANANAAVYPPKRPMAARAQSYNRERKPQATAAASNPVDPIPSTTTGGGYQSQVLPTPKDQARKHHRRHRDIPEAQRPRSRRDSGVSVSDAENGKYSSSPGIAPYNNAVVPYDRTAQPSTRSDASRQALAQTQPSKTKPVRPSMGRRQSSRGGSYQIPVRSKGRKAVRFAALPQ